MDNVFIKSNPTTDAEYITEFEQIMAKIKQHEAPFDKLHAEVTAMQAATERKDA